MADAALRLLETPSTPATTEDEATTQVAELVEPGRLVELSASPRGATARTSTAVALLRRVQREGETTAWVQPTGAPLYPPDLHEGGIDLDALVVVHVPPAEGSAGLGKAAELLLRSGAFGLVVVDLGATEPRARTAWQGRLLGLARQHESRILLLTEKPSQADSLGPLVGLRVEPRRHRHAQGAFTVEHDVLKNKSGAPIAVATDRFTAPPGLH
ncbi:MAG: recombinase A [Myxococcota bacterium]